MLRNYMIRTLDGQREHIVRGASLDTVIDMEPADFLISANDQETYTTPQLTAYIAKQKNRGVANIAAFEIEKEKRYAMTAAAFILTLTGMALSSRKVKGGMGLNIRPRGHVDTQLRLPRHRPGALLEGRKMKK